MFILDLSFGSPAGFAYPLAERASHVRALHLFLMNQHLELCTVEESVNVDIGMYDNRCMYTQIVDEVGGYNIYLHCTGYRTAHFIPALAGPMFCD